MADYLVYWKTFRRQLKRWGQDAIDAHWFTKNKYFYERVVPKEDNLWVVISGGSNYPNEWRLLQRMHIVGKRIEHPADPDYGKYHFVGDSPTLENFDVARQGNLERTLRELEFESGTRITAKGSQIGHAIQSYRPLVKSDVQKLTQFLHLPPPIPKEVIKTLPQLDKQLAEKGYVRTSQAGLRRIMRLHNKLSNAFCDWLRRSGYELTAREQEQVDLRFEVRGKAYCAELKVVQGIGSTQAIREALGQLLEYNYYPGRKPAEQWVIMLDKRPTQKDIEYLDVLKEKLELPLTLGWQDRSTFSFAEKQGLGP